MQPYRESGLRVDAYSQWLNFHQKHRTVTEHLSPRLSGRRSLSVGLKRHVYGLIFVVRYSRIRRPEMEVCLSKFRWHKWASGVITTEWLRASRRSSWSSLKLSVQLRSCGRKAFKKLDIHGRPQSTVTFRTATKQPFSVRAGSCRLPDLENLGQKLKGLRCRGVR